MVSLEELGLALLRVRWDAAREGCCLSWLTAPKGQPVGVAEGALELAGDEALLAGWLRAERCESFPPELSAAAAEALVAEDVPAQLIDLAELRAGLLALEGDGLPDGSLLAGLNWLWDLARTLERPELAALLLTPAALGRVMDWLSPIAQTSAAPSVSARRAAVEGFDRVVEGLDPCVRALASCD